MHKHAHIAAAVSSSASGIRSSHTVPEDMQRQWLVRLKTLVSVAAAIWLVNFSLNAMGPSFFGWAQGCAYFGMAFNGILLAISVAFAVMVKRRVFDTQRLLDLGLVYQVIAAFGVAFAEQFQPVISISAVAIVILLFPLFVPSTPGKTLIAAFASAAMAPLAQLFFVFGSSGAALPQGAIQSDIINFGVALLAIIPSKVVAGLARDISKARRMGSYELTQKIGAGGMGEVWRARHRMLRRPAAIKLIRPESLGARDEASVRRAVERFQREAQVTAALESAHTVELYDFGVTEQGVLFHVMELLRGTDLESLVRRYGPLPPERVVHLLRQICDSLDDAHRAGLVHRDIKPANIFVTRRGRRHDFIKVLDFGLAKDLHHSLDDDELPSPSLTQADQVIGTPSYLAPEMATGEAQVDGRADIYAVGCVAYWLLTGELVFEETGAMQMAIAHATRAPELPSERAGVEIPEALEALVMSCLEKKPEDRPQSAEILDERLTALADAQAWTPAQAERWWTQHDELLEDDDAEPRLLPEAQRPLLQSVVA